MNYLKVISLVPEGEHFDETAIGEGVYLTVSHLNAIETELGKPPAVDTAMQTQLQEANESIKNLNTQMATMHSQESVNVLNAKITTLEAQVKELGGAGSGTGTVLETKADEVVTGAPKKALTLNDANHPVNLAVTAQLKAKENAHKLKNS